MRNSTINHLLLIGLPNTGKTSFLAALWYMVGQSSSNCALKLTKLDGDSQYLNQIRDAWLEYRFVPRNRADSEKLVAMWLEHRDTKKTIQLSFPDLAGEAFGAQWTQRHLSEACDRTLRGASGALLFVNPGGISKPHDILEVNATLLGIGGKEELKQTVKVEDGEWKREKSPTQVQLVDILQLMTGQGYFQAPFRLAIIASAWDQVVSKKQSPSEFVDIELPLLKQFLEANDDLFDVCFYGVSAQGGRYALPHFWSDNFTNSHQFAKRLCERGDPISEWIWAKLDDGSKATLELLRENKKATEPQKRALAGTFNRLMAEPDVYDAARFKGVELRPETEVKLNAGLLQNDEKKLYLIRLLLEDAYPDELSKARENDEEALALRKKMPEDRVLVVADEGKTSHDVTEPLQWLMR